MPRVRDYRGRGNRRQPIGVAEIRRRDETPTSAARDLGSCVYVVRLPEGLIKIGFTTNLGRRIHQLGCQWADLLLAVPGTFEEEQALHRRWNLYLARGREYYFPTRELMAWVNAERERLGAAAV